MANTGRTSLLRYALLSSAISLYGAGFFDPFLPYTIWLLLGATIAGGIAYARTRAFPYDLISLISAVGLIHPTSVLTGIPDLRLTVFPLVVAVGAVFSTRTLLIVGFFALGPVGVGTREVPALLASFGAVGLCCLLPALFMSREKNTRRSLQDNLRRLTADARSLDQRGLQEADSFLEEDTFQDLVGSVIELRQNLDHTIYLVKNVIPCNTAAYFSLEEDSQLILRSYLTDSPPLSDRPIRLGEGYAGLVAREKKPILVGDLKKRRMQPGYYRHRANLGSLIGVPVMEGSVLLGVLVVDSPEEDAFFDKDRAILDLFGDDIVGLNRKARTYTQIHNSARGFKALHDISSELIKTMRLDEMAKRLVELSAKVVENDLCILFLRKRDAIFQILASKGYDPTGREQVDGDKSMLDWLASGDHNLFHISDLQRQPTKMIPFETKRLRTFLGLPLIHEGKVEAVLAVGSRHPNAFDARSIDLLKVLANLAAVSVANARLHRKIEKMAHTDGLTGLFNHRHFQERLAGEFARLDRYPGNLSFCLMDIDHFKKVNDTYGHPAGDAVLKGVAGILQSTLRSAADFPARYGGEEFAVVLVNTDGEGALKIAERLRKRVAKEAFPTDAGPLRITLSVGICTYPAEAATKQSLIERADQALYQAKRTGRNRCIRYRDVPSKPGDDPSRSEAPPDMTAWDRP